MEIYRELFARFRRKRLSPLRAAAEAARQALAIRLSQPAARILRRDYWNEAALHSSDPRPIAIFAHHDAAGVVSDAALGYLERLRAVSSAIIFVTTSEPLNVAGIERVRHHAEIAIVRTNIGYDFGSWKVGIAEAGSAARKGLILANDSVIGPRADLTPIFAEMSARPLDLWGMTDSHEIAPHLQSYFLAATGETATAPWFRAFWERVSHLPSRYKYLIVRLYEVGLSTAARAHGCRLGARFETAQLLARYADRHPGLAIEKVNPTTQFWRELVLDEGFPFLKKGLLRPEIRAAFGAESIEDFIAEHFA